MEAPPSLRALIATWARIGALSFGGPAGQIALMHKTLVEEKRWLGEQQFLHALNFCMLLPGPEAQQLATYSGWLTHGVRGGLIAGLLFILPGAFLMMALAAGYVTAGQHPLVYGMLLGVQAVVIALVLEALLRVSRRALKQPWHWGIALAAFAALALARAPFPLVIVVAGVAGALLARGEGGQPEAGPVPRGRPWRTLGLGLALWFAPVALAALLVGPDHLLTRMGLFFSQMAVVTFGGAYAVLAYVGQAAVEGYGWLTPSQMLHGLGLAETTPGPLILVLQFVGFVGAHANPAPFSPLIAGILGALMALWTTFAPCFLWIFLGAPHIERLRSHVRLAGALAGITAAVVGVIASLGLWFAGHVLVVAGSFQVVPAAIAVAAMVALVRFHVPLIAVIAAGAIAGLLTSM